MTERHPFAVPFEVRDYECDLQGIVNNAVYQHYLEHARHQWLKRSGLTFAALANAGINLVVVRAEIDYKSASQNLPWAATGRAARPARSEEEGDAGFPHQRRRATPQADADQPVPGEQRRWGCGGRASAPALLLLGVPRCRYAIVVAPWRLALALATRPTRDFGTHSKSPLRSGEAFVVTSRMERISLVRFGFLQEIHRIAGGRRVLVLKAKIICAAMDAHGKPMVPAVLEPLFRLSAEQSDGMDDAFR